ncbi:MAG: hypothetical protein EDR02_03350 [Actinobacteria bacterium]|nr:MAG: hypothetical protein EDR02_03350 [Actinomycetota bacterium]RIK06247.1 MAG: hypothetical protein DCC48_07395 [Acidobacteriota bacterium]
MEMLWSVGKVLLPLPLPLLVLVAFVAGRLLAMRRGWDQTLIATLIGCGRVRPEPARGARPSSARRSTRR